MAVFIENCEELMDLLPNRNEARIRFEIKSTLLNPQSNLENYLWKETYFIMSNLEWRLLVGTQYGKIRIELGCQSQTPAMCFIKINSCLRILNIERNEIVQLDNLPQQIFSKQGVRKWLVKEYTIDAKYRQNQMVIMEVLINAQSNMQCELGNNTLKKWYEQFQANLNNLQERFQTLEVTNNNIQTNIEELQTINTEQQIIIEQLREKLIYYDEDEDSMKMFKETLRLFKNKSLKKFEHEMRLSKDVEVHLEISPVETSVNNVANKPDARDKIIEEYKSRLQQMETEINKRENDNLELNKKILESETKYSENIQQQEAKVVKLKQKNLAITKRLTDQDTKTVELEQKLAAMKSTVEEQKVKLSHLEDDQKRFEVFQQALHLFESKSCRIFEHEFELSDNEKIQFNMVLKESEASKSSDEKELSGQREKELEAEVIKLKQRLKQQKQNSK